MRHKLSNIFLVLGILLLLVGIYCYLIFWLIVFSFPSLIIGAVLILLTKKNWRFKLICIGIPLIFVGISFYISFTTPETYLIPDGYKGEVYVIFNQKKGQEIEFERNRRLYRIPPTGVLFTKFKDEEGFINQEYYYITNQGKRRKLGVLDTRDFNEKWTDVKNLKEPPRDSIAVFNPGVMGTMGNSGDKNSKVYTELSVGTYNDIETFKHFKTEYIDSLQNTTKKSD